MKRSDIDQVFDQYAPMVHRRALAILGNEADAKDATQEVFIKALTHADSFAGRSQVSTWLYRITTNTCLNVLRSAKRRRALHDKSASDDKGESTNAVPEHAVLVQRLLSEADERCARAAVYVHIDGMSHAETSKMLGVSKRTVGNLLSRFQVFAREYLERDGLVAEAG